MLTGVLGSQLAVLGGFQLGQVPAAQSALEEGSSPAPSPGLFVQPGIFGFVGGEELVSLPLEEPGTIAAVIAAPGPSAMATFGEDFAGSGPFEESASAPVPLGAFVPPWITGLNAFEEFRSPTLDEPGVMAMLWASPPLAWIAPAEDFAGSLPLDEFGATSPPPTEIIARTDIARSEEFAGSMPAEEDGAVAVVAPEGRPPQFLIAEDFAGSLPLEEDAALYVPAPLGAWVTVGPWPEEFAGSLPLEEDGACAMVTATVALPLFSSNEEFAGALPFEDSSVWMVRAAPVPVWAASVAEDFAGAPFAEETGALTFVPTIRVATSFWIDEEFPAHAPTPPFFGLLLLGGAEWRDDYFFDRYADLAWELGFDEYHMGRDSRGGYVTFRQFEQKILQAQREEEKRDEFRQMTTVFEQEALERARLVKKAITVAGVTYIVWRIITWL